HARLQDTIAAHDAALALVVHRAIERMRDRADERARGAARQHGVGIERNDVLDGIEPGYAALDCRKRIARSTAQIRVEFGQLAPLPFPAHPRVLAGVPASWADEEIEWRTLTGVGRIQRANSAHRGAHDLRVARDGLLRGVVKSP